MTTNNTRADDARLHELLTGEKCEMRASEYDHDYHDFRELQSLYDGTRIGSELDQERLDEVIKEANESSEGWQPCVPKPNGNGWDVVPLYSERITDARAAETALPVELREDYAHTLDSIVNPLDSLIVTTGMGGADYTVNRTALYALITATPAQRAAAMVSVLERARRDFDEATKNHRSSLWFRFVLHWLWLARPPAFFAIGRARLGLALTSL